MLMDTDRCMLPTRALYQRRYLLCCFYASTAVLATKWNALSPNIRELKPLEANNISHTILATLYNITGNAIFRRCVGLQQVFSKVCWNYSFPATVNFLQTGASYARSERWA